MLGDGYVERLGIGMRRSARRWIEGRVRIGMIISDRRWMKERVGKIG